MANCTHCGAEITDTAFFCDACGMRLAAPSDEAPKPTEVQEEAAASPDVAPEVPKPASRKLRFSLFLWSIANMALSLLNPLGIVGLAFTFLAASAEEAEEEQRRLRIAKKCNLIASILGGVFLVTLSALVFFNLLQIACLMLL